MSVFVSSRFFFCLILSHSLTFGYVADIGARMGKITTKIALISLLHKYNFECLDDRELEFDVHSVTLAVKDGINVRVTNRKM